MTANDSDNVREQATIDEETGEVHPPEVRVEGDVFQYVIDAVEAAVDEHPNACDAPTLWSPEEAPRDVSEHCEAVMTARYNEMPVVADDGSLDGWLPPYRARENIYEAIQSELDGRLHLEAIDRRVGGFYR